VSIDPSAYVDPTAVVDPGASIGARTRIWHFCHVMSGAVIGADSSFGQGCYVAGSVRVGERVKVQNNVSLYDGVTLDDEVFVGPSAVFTNVENPRAGVVKKAEYQPTRVRRGASIGANATVVCGVTLGEYCFVAAGAVVTRDVPDHALVAGVPARRIGWMSRHGERLDFDAEGEATCPATGERYGLDGEVVKMRG
jgi:UDP-2-acetamido-3-amino-2,3-dideoxy-glucuronate N-acetyltransferase